MNDKLNRLENDSVWIFTKQSISFDEIFKSVQLLKYAIDNDIDNIEDFFAKKHLEYGIETDRHRILIMAQFFGLLSKSKYYTRGGRYLNERPTEVFEKLCEYGIGTKEYNILKSEQILKLKFRAIIDSAKVNDGYNILPVIYCYNVLKELKERYKITEVDVNKAYTYIFTCKNHSELQETVNHIKNNEPTTTHIDTYKGRSRYVPLLTENINLFVIQNGKMSINTALETQFDRFLETIDIDSLERNLSRAADYAYFLTCIQDFNINLIDYENTAGIVNSVSVDKDDDDETEYAEKVNRVRETTINEDIVKDAHTSKPTISTTGQKKRYNKNPMVGKVAIKNNDYKCEVNNSHTTFISATTHKPYMEAHHLIPMSYIEEMWDKFGVNIDCKENIVSLCPSCHRRIHYSEKDDKRQLITDIFNKKKSELRTVGLKITLNKLLSMYGL